MSESIRKIVRNSFFQTFNAFGTTGINFLLTFACTRILGPELFGSLVAAQAHVLVCVMLVDLGLYNGLIGALTYEKDPGRQYSLLWKSLGLRFLGALVGTAIVYAVALQSSDFWLHMAFVPHLFAYGFQYTLAAYGSFRERQELTVWANLVGVVVSVVAAIYSLWEGYGLAQVLLCQSLGGFLAGLIILVGLRWEGKIHFAWRGSVPWRALVHDSWPYAACFAALVLWQRLDQIAVAHFLGHEELGQYGLAVKMVGLPMAFAFPVSAALFPDLQRLGRDAPEKVALYISAVTKFLFRAGWLIAAVALGVVAIVMPWLFPKFVAAKHLLFWFLPGLWFYWMQNMLMNGLFGLKRYGAVVAAHGGAVVLFLVALLVLIPRFGVEGAALSYNTFSIALFFLLYRQARRLGAIPAVLLSALTPAEAELLRTVSAKLFFWKRGTVAGARP